MRFKYFVCFFLVVVFLATINNKVFSQEPTEGETTSAEEVTAADGTLSGEYTGAEETDIPISGEETTIDGTPSGEYTGEETVPTEEEEVCEILERESGNTGREYTSIYTPYQLRDEVDKLKRGQKSKIVKSYKHKKDKTIDIEIYMSKRKTAHLLLQCGRRCANDNDCTRGKHICEKCGNRICKPADNTVKCSPNGGTFGGVSYTCTAPKVCDPFLCECQCPAPRPGTEQCQADGDCRGGLVCDQKICSCVACGKATAETKSYVFQGIWNGIPWRCTGTYSGIKCSNEHNICNKGGGANGKCTTLYKNKRVCEKYPGIWFVRVPVGCGCK